MLVRLGRDDKHIAEARELFEASAESDFYTLMRAWQFARNNGYDVERCRRYGVHAQIARQVQQTFEQILAAARAPAGAAPEKAEALPRCIAAGFMDQLCRRRDQGTLDCDVVDGRSGALMRESVVQNAPLFVAAIEFDESTSAELERIGAMREPFTGPCTPSWNASSRATSGL